MTHFTLKTSAGEAEVGGSELVGRTLTAIGRDGFYDGVLIVGAQPHVNSPYSVSTPRLILRPESGRHVYVELADLGDPVVSDERQHPVMTVRVANRGHSRSYEGVRVTTVTIVKSCPLCGGPRGDVRDGRVIEDGEHYHVHNWDNPCGHLDVYSSVLVEAGVHPREEER